MKKVFSSQSSLAHIWASLSQDRGQTSNGNMYFNGPTIYSYGGHFPIARLLEAEKIALFTKSSYSISTSKHMREARRAIPLEYRVIYCYNPEIEPSEHDSNMNEWRADIAQLREKALEAKNRVTKGNLARDIFNIQNEVMEYCRAFNTVFERYPEWALTNEEETLAREYVRARAQERERTREQRQAQARANAANRAMGTLKAWLSGEGNSRLGLDNFGMTYLRAIGDAIETSRGASIPKADALALWPLLLRARQTGRAIEAGLRVIPVGPYSFKSFDGNTLIVGCHSIDWSEIEKIAIQLNLIAEEQTA